MFRDTSSQRFVSFDAVVLSADISVSYFALNKGGLVGKSHDIAVLIDCRRRIPPRGWRIWINIHHGAIFPKHGMLGRMSSNGLVADTGDADDLTIIIDRRRSSRAVAGD